MAWITITEADLLTQISGAELSSIRAAVLGSGQADPVASTITQTVRYVRGRVAACADNQVGPAGTIPDELLSQALAIIVLEFMRRPGGLQVDPEGARMRAGENAERILRDVAACNVVLEQPDTPSSEVLAVQTPSFVGRDAAYGRELEEGI